MHVYEFEGGSQLKFLTYGFIGIRDEGRDEFNNLRWGDFIHSEGWELEDKFQLEDLSDEQLPGYHQWPESGGG